MIVAPEKSFQDTYNFTLTIDQKSLGRQAGKLKIACPVCRTHLVVKEPGEYACDWCGTPIGLFAYAAHVWTIQCFRTTMSAPPQVLA